MAYLWHTTLDLAIPNSCHRHLRAALSPNSCWIPDVFERSWAIFKAHTFRGRFVVCGSNGAVLINAVSGHLAHFTHFGSGCLTNKTTTVIFLYCPGLECGCGLKALEKVLTNWNVLGFVPPSQLCEEMMSRVPAMLYNQQTLIQSLHNMFLDYSSVEMTIADPHRDCWSLPLTVMAAAILILFRCLAR